MRVFIMVADSFGIGELPDAAKFGDAGSNTFRACYDTGVLSVPLKYMHSPVEMLNIADAEAVTELLCGFLTDGFERGVLDA